MYESFEGSIPGASYGAGTMRIWDAGTYEVRKAKGIAQALEKGELKLELRGRRLRGEWHLVRTSRSRGRTGCCSRPRPLRRLGQRPVRRRGHEPGNAEAAAAPRDAHGGGDGKRAFDDPDWLFEPAFPGRRVLARVEDTQINLQAGTRT